jgi:GDSL-like Lipase/Acylhydrolase family
MTHRRTLVAGGLSIVLLAAACHEDDLFITPPPPYTGGAMFQRYVAIGNSITAGFQSGGINDSTQKQSYAVLVGGVMGGDPFYYPSLYSVGCPPPFTNIFTGARVGGAGVTGTTCLFRNPNIPPYLSNVAVPGAETIDMLSNGPAPGTHSNPLTLLFLGGRTQVRAMMDARPTFVSVWAGNNDLLGGAQAGDTTLATDTAAFRLSYSRALDSIGATGSSAILIAVGLGHLANNVVLPFFSRGTTWYGLWAGGSFSAQAPFFTVAANCAPPRGDTVLVSFPYGFGLLAAGASTATTLDCTAPPVIEPAETRFFALLQLQYNAIIQAQAAARGWAFTDSVNVMLDSLAGVANQFAPFPNTAAACSGSPFGLAFSCDGIHPSQATHQRIARKVVRAINAKYGSAIPAP